MKEWWRFMSRMTAFVFGEPGIRCSSKHNLYNERSTKQSRFTGRACTTLSWIGINASPQLFDARTSRAQSEPGNIRAPCKCRLSPSNININNTTTGKINVTAGAADLCAGLDVGFYQHPLHVHDALQRKVPNELDHP